MDVVEDILGPPTIGHNSAGLDDPPTIGHNSTGEELKGYIQRIEAYEADKREIADDIKEVYAEAKARGWDTKAMRRVIAFRKRNRDDIAEEDAVFEQYLHVLGMI